MSTLHLNDILQTEIPSQKAVILVTGPYQAGKTSFLTTISDRVWEDVEAPIQVSYYTDGENPEHFKRQETTTVSLGQLTLDDDTALLFLETRGALRFDFLFEGTGISDELLGVVIIFNSAYPETFREAKSIIETMRAYAPLQYVVAANKQDDPEAWALDDLRIALRLEGTDKLLLPCVATHQHSAKTALLSLLEIIPDNPIISLAMAKLTLAPDEDDWLARLNRIKQLGDSDDTDPIAYLTNASHDSDWRVRWNVPIVLEKLHNSRAIVLLTELLRDTHPLVRMSAVKSLGNIGDAVAVEPLFSTLQDDDKDVRLATIRALVQLGDTSAVQHLSELLDDTDGMIRLTAAKALGQFGKEGFSALLAAIQNIEPPSHDAARVLGDIGDLQAVEPLIAVLQSKGVGARRAAAVALGKLKDNRAVEPLLDTLQDYEARVRDGAAFALGELGDLRAVEPLLLMLQDSDECLREPAARALGKLGDVRAVEPLIIALQDEAVGVRRIAANALKEIGTPEALAAVENWRNQP